MVSPTPNYAECIRTISVVEGRPTIEIPEPFGFRCQLSPPIERKADDLSPRETEPRSKLRWPVFYSGDPVLTAGARLSVDTEDYEIMSNPEPLSRGFKVFGYETQILRISLLYPITGEARTQEGTVLGNTEFAIWSPSERANEQGEYEDYSGETDIGYASIFRRNISLFVGDPVVRYRVMAVSTIINPPRIVFTARRAGG